MLEDRGASPKKTETCSVNTRPYTRKTGKLSQELAAGGCGGWRGGKEKAERGERNEKKSKSGKREVEGERERVEIKTRFLDRVSSEVFEDLSHVSDVESVVDSFGFFGVFVRPSASVPVVTVPSRM